MIINYEKMIGETMSEVVNRFKHEYNVSKVAFAGRLDPLAYGCITMLTDRDIYKQEEYQNRSKIYETFMIHNFKTDTYDIMGMPNISYDFNYKYRNMVNTTIRQEYPPFSSKTVLVGEKKMKLWDCYRKGIEYEKQYKDIILHNAECLGKMNISSKDLLELILHRISLVKGIKFRQEEIIKRWKYIMDECDDELIISKWRFTVSSGGYIRYFGNEMNGCCFDIKRTKYI